MARTFTGQCLNDARAKVLIGFSGGIEESTITNSGSAWIYSEYAYAIYDLRLPVIRRYFPIVEQICRGKYPVSYSKV
jgi:hypothetical protein